MWLSLVGISKRRVWFSAKVLRAQNQKRLYRKTRPVSAMFLDVWPPDDDKEPPRNQDSWRKSLLEMKNVKDRRDFKSSDVRTKLAKIASQIEDYEIKTAQLQQLRENLLAELKTMNKSDEFVEKWMSEEFPWSEDINFELKTTFGIRKLKPTQLQVINATLSNKDVIVVMATGHGKSLCYQLSALMTKGICLVICPLTSLMQDQVLSMKKLGVEAEFITASSPVETTLKVYSDLETSNTSLKLLYITPEKLAKSKKFISQLYKCYELGNLSRIAIDEVHCAAQWGYDFRPDYRIVGTLKQLFPEVPLLGLTATCSDKRLEEVKEILSTPQALVFQSPVSRGNLFYEVRTKPDKHEQVVDDMARTIKGSFSGQSGIVYCLSRRGAEHVCTDLKSRGINCAVYHAGMPAGEKKNMHEKWLSDDIQVMCATSAFGMGINKPDVRFVFHHTMSKSMDSYHQESGRAGRDGLPALCLLYYGFSDIARVNSLVFKDRNGLRNFAKVLDYCQNTKRCRHEMIAQHFGEELKRCSKVCDVCNNFYERNVSDVTLSCRELMRIVQSSENRLTGVMLVNEYLKKRKDRSKWELHRIITHMISSSYLRQEFQPSYQTITYIGPGRRAHLLGRVKTKLNLPLAIARGERVYEDILEELRGRVCNANDSNG